MESQKAQEGAFLSLTSCSGLAGCKEFSLSFGGHRQAAVCGLRLKTFCFFEKAIQRIVETALSKEDLVPHLRLMRMWRSEVNHSLIREIAMLEPVGCSNKEPFLAARKLEVVNPRIVGNNHLKMKLNTARIQWMQ